jgi:chaperonin GroES
MNIRPVNGRVLIRPLQPSNETREGIIIPDTAKEKPREGVVIAVAEDATEEVAVGDHVIYKEYGGTEIRIEGEDFVLCTAEDLVAKHEDVDKIPE